MAQRSGQGEARDAAQEVAPRGLRLRTLVVALVIVVASVRLSVHQNMVQSAGGGVDYALAVLLVLVLLEPVVGRRFGLGRRSYLYIYMATLVGVGVYDGVSRFLPVYTAAQYFAAPDNNYDQIAATYPSWFIPKDPDLIRQFHEGATGPVNMMPWVQTIGVWTLFFAVLWATLLCICVLLRRHRVEDERLAFPLVQVPLYITGFARTSQQSHGSIWRQPLMWAGFLVATIHFASIMAHGANPSLPTLGPGYNLGQFFTEHPLNALSVHFLFVHNPHLVGLAYFAPQDVCFSIFFIAGTPARREWAPDGRRQLRCGLQPRGQPCSR